MSSVICALLHNITPESADSGAKNEKVWVENFLSFENDVPRQAPSHGAGMKEIFVSENLCAYALHLAASNLAFLIKQANLQG